MEEGVNSTLVKFADDTKLEGVTDNNEDRGLIQMALKNLRKSQGWGEKTQVELIKISIGKIST